MRHQRAGKKLGRDSAHRRALYANLAGARIYVTGTNLFTWTDYSGFNPDVSSISVANLNRGIDIGAYPLARTWTAGVNLSY